MEDIHDLAFAAAEVLFVCFRHNIGKVLKI
jgi:hypothetical protein